MALRAAAHPADVLYGLDQETCSGALPFSPSFGERVGDPSHSCRERQGGLYHKVGNRPNGHRGRTSRPSPPRRLQLNPRDDASKSIAAVSANNATPSPCRLRRHRSHTRVRWKSSCQWPVRVVSGNRFIVGQYERCPCTCFINCVASDDRLGVFLTAMLCSRRLTELRETSPEGATQFSPARSRRRSAGFS